MGFQLNGFQMKSQHWRFLRGREPQDRNKKGQLSFFILTDHLKSVPEGHPQSIPCSSVGYSNPISPLLTPAQVETLRSRVSQRIRGAEPTCPTPRAPVPPGRGSEERARRGRREGTQEIQGKRAGQSGRPESPPEDLPPFYPSKRPHENKGLDSEDGAAAERRQQARRSSPSLPRAAAHPPRAVGTFSLLATPIHPTYLCQLQTCPVFSPNKLASLRETLKVSPLLIPLISF